MKMKMEEALRRKEAVDKHQQSVGNEEKEEEISSDHEIVLLSGTSDREAKSLDPECKEIEVEVEVEIEIELGVEAEIGVVEIENEDIEIVPEERTSDSEKHSFGSSWMMFGVEELMNEREGKM